MVVDDLSLAQALGPGGADIVGAEHLQHVRPGVAHQGAHGDHRQYQHRQHQVVGHVQDLSHAVELVVVAPDEAHQIKPAQAHGENQLHQGGEEEGGQRDTHQGKGGDRVVRPGVLLGGGHHPQGDGNNQLQNQGNGPHDEGGPDAVLEDIYHGLGELPAVAEVAPDHLAQLHEVAGDDAHIQMVLRVELVKPLAVGLAAGLLAELHGHGLHVACGQTAHQHIDDKADKEQDHHAEQQALDNVFSHVLPSNS